MTGSELWRECVDAARYAPSKHNAQPWWFEIHGKVAELHADGARAMPASDPRGRELVIGCGAALYNLLLAVRCRGREPLVALLPEGSAQSVLARVAMDGPHVPTEEERALFGAIPDRHTNRNPLDATLLPPSLPFLIQRAAEAEGATLHLLPGAGAQSTLDQVVTDADRLAVRDPALGAELRQWVRRAGADADDGIPVTAISDGAAAAYRGRFVERDFDVYGEAAPRPGFPGEVDRPLPAVLCTPGDLPIDWLRAGLALEAVLLTATVLGASASFLNQPLERPELRTVLRTDLDLPGFPQMVLRFGVGVPASPTPRRPLGDVVVEP